MFQLLNLLKNSNDTQKNEILEKLTCSDPSSPEFGTAIDNLLCEKSKISNPKKIDSIDISSRNVIRVHAVNETVQNGEPAIYGPSSIYIPGSNVSGDGNTIVDFEKFHHKMYIDLIENFFVWRYPDVTMFIHRESFLTDFYKSKNDIKVSATYCGEELIYALCCLGSIDMDVVEPHKISHHFYHLARDMIFDKLRTESYSSIVMIQALLTLSVYDLGRGNNVSAWLLSGIAIRLGEHKGLSHEPLEWKSDSENTTLSDYDIRVRSRIYWGCYLTEHFIANVLGRMSILNSKQTTIRDTDDLPVLQGIDQFCYKDPLDTNYNIKMDLPTPLLLLDEMYRICENFKPLIFSKETDDITSSLNQLKEFTHRMFEWREDLPVTLKWNNDVLQAEGHNHVLMNPRNQYFLALLSFHRPFITDNLSDTSCVYSTQLCLQIISEIELSVNAFQKVQNINKCSLVTVYNVILSIMIIMMMSKLPTTADTKLFENKLDTLSFFVNILKDMSSSWSIAGKYYNSIFSTYSTSVKEYLQNTDQERTTTPSMQDVGSLDFPVDFDNDIFSNEEMTNIFDSILGEMSNFNYGGFIGLDFSTDNIPG